MNKLGDLLKTRTQKAGKNHGGQWFSLILAFSFLCILPTATIAKTGDVIIVGGDHNYPPYEFLDKDGNPTGYNVELTRAIAEVMGIKVKIQLGDWDMMRKGLT